MQQSRNKLRILLFLIAFISCYPLAAQLPKFELDQISQDKGGKIATVNYLFQDSKGIMWISIESHGLAKYDGYNFQLYSNIIGDSTSLSHDVIKAICEDDKGNLWVGTEHGLNIFNRKKQNFKRIYSNDGDKIYDNLIYHLEKDNNGDIWIATNKGISKYNSRTGQFTKIRLNNGFGTIVNSVKADRENKIWVTTQKGLFYIKDDRVFSKKIINPRTKKEIHNVDQIEFCSDSTILASSSMQVYRFREDDDKVEIISLNDKEYIEAHRYVTDIHQDKRGNVWISTTIDGLAVYFPKTGVLQQFKADERNKKGLKSNYIRDLYEDKDGIIWIATKFEGIQTFNYKCLTIPHFNKEGQGINEFSTKSVVSISPAPNNCVYIGTSGGGMYHFNRKTQSLHKILNNEHKELARSRINDFKIDKQNNLWIGGTGYLYKADSSLNKIQKTAPIDIKCLLFDLNDNLWIGALNGLYIYKDGKLKPFHSVYGTGKELYNSFVRNLILDTKQNIWIATKSNGLFRINLKTNEFDSFSAEQTGKNHISGNLIRGIYESKDGSIWVGTKGYGLNRFSWKDSTFTTYRQKDGLPSNTIFGILEDSLQNLWLSTYHGICRFNYKTLETERFTKDYGLQNNMFETKANAKTPDGYMYFGGNNGFNWFSPYELKTQAVSSKLILTTISVLGHEQYFDVDSSINLDLNYNQNLISFNYALLDYSSSVQKKYRYMMQGVDENYSKNTSNNNASYTNLEPGNYVFKLQAQNLSGEWTEPLCVSISIAPPWWKTNWFRVQFIAFLLISISAYIYRKSHQYKNKRKELERLVTKRTSELANANKTLLSQSGSLEEQNKNLLEQQMVIQMKNIQLEEALDSKDRLIGVIAHDFKNPLTSIGGLSEHLSQNTDKMSSKEIKQISKSISSSSKKLEMQMLSVLDWAQSQLQDIKYNPVEINIGVLIDDAIELVKESSLQKQIEINTQLDFETKALIDARMMNTVLRNLLVNAIKFTPQGGAITITAQELDEAIEISVIDSGIGMDEKTAGLLFSGKSIESQYDTEHKKGSGLGLEICKKFIEKNKGSISVSSQLGEGSVFTVSIPKGEDPAKPKHKTSTIGADEGYTATISTESDTDIDKDKSTNILIIDDSVEIVSALKLLFNTDYSVFTAHDGKSGLQLAKNIVPHLIISDINMPLMNGVDLCSTLKNDTLTNHIPIILMTSMNTQAASKEGYSSGADDFIEKPLNTERLKHKVKSLLKNRKQLLEKIQETKASKTFIFPESYDDIIMKKALKYINENFSSSKFEINNISDEVGVSRTQLWRKFKSSTGQNLSDYIQDLRFQKAQEMLSSGKYRVFEVAYAVGYSSSPYFTKCFSKKFGISPKEYIDKNKDLSKDK